jgi:hypothetical protein
METLQKDSYIQRRYKTDNNFKQKMKDISKAKRENRTNEQKEASNEYMRQYRITNNLNSKSCILCNKKIGKRDEQKYCIKCNNIIEIYNTVNKIC